jgi:hypothetical protein
MFAQRIAECRKMAAELDAWEQRLSGERLEALAKLPESFGYRDMDTFIRAVKEAARPPERRRRGAPGRPRGAASRGGAGPRAGGAAEAIPPERPVPAPVPAPASALGVAPGMAAAARRVQGGLELAARSSGGAGPVKPAVVELVSRPAVAAGGAPAPAGAPSKPAAGPAWPTGTSLEDPANFGLLPDRSVFAAGDLPATVQRERMRAALDFTNKVLHTSKVPAAVWREWRQFERQLLEVLREAAAA